MVKHITRNDKWRALTRRSAVFLPSLSVPITDYFLQFWFYDSIVLNFLFSLKYRTRSGFRLVYITIWKLNSFGHGIKTSKQMKIVRLRGCQVQYYGHGIIISRSNETTNWIIVQWLGIVDRRYCLNSLASTDEPSTQCQYIKTNMWYELSTIH